MSSVWKSNTPAASSGLNCVQFRLICPEMAFISIQTTLIQSQTTPDSIQMALN